MWRTIAVALFLALSGLAVAASAADTTNVVLSLQRERSGHVSVEVSLNGQPARLLVDTGANVSTLDETLGKRFGAAFSVEPNASEGNPAHAAPAVSKDGKPLGSDTFSVMDLSFINFMPKRMGTPLFDGQLGASFFRANNAVIDFEKMELRLKVPARSSN